MRFFTFLFCLFFGIVMLPLKGQNSIRKDSLIREAKIQAEIRKNKVRFEAETPALRQIAGAPEAFYTYFWEFGDGHYSTESQPEHVYKNPGEYQVRLYATNNYDDGKPPTSRPKKVAITTTGAFQPEDENTSLLTAQHGFSVYANRDPVPEESLQFVVRYANTGASVLQGKLYVFYNEKKYKSKSFALTDVRTYYGEHALQEASFVAGNTRVLRYKDFIAQSGSASLLHPFYTEKDTFELHNLPKTLSEAHTTFTDYSAWEFDNLQPQEARNLFFEFRTTPEMLKDTSAIIRIRTVFVPDKNADLHQIRDKEMEIVTSHDPNKMAVYDTRLNYRLVRFKRLKYKVRFQNNGEGPAKTIKLNVEIPEIFDKASLRVEDSYPKVPICPDGETVSYSCLDTIRFQDHISFQFKNIYLPGSRQAGVKEKDSTKGFVKYSLKFGKDFHKIPTQSKTEIIFDNNEPIVTNIARTHFATGLSIGARAGYGIPHPIMNLVNYNDKSHSEIYFAGITLSPYKPYKWYYQAELDMQVFRGDWEMDSNRIEDSASGRFYVEEHNKYKLLQNSLNLVPASIRKNVNAFFSWGAGVQVSYNMLTKYTNQKDQSFFIYNPETGLPEGDELIDLHKHTEKTQVTRGYWKVLPFFDITGGLSRIGPSLGLRYFFPAYGQGDYLQFYAVWKF